MAKFQGPSWREEGPDGEYAYAGDFFKSAFLASPGTRNTLQRNGLGLCIGGLALCILCSFMHGAATIAPPRVDAADRALLSTTQRLGLANICDFFNTVSGSSVSSKFCWPRQLRSGTVLISVRFWLADGTRMPSRLRSIRNQDVKEQSLCADQPLDGPD